jgi:hypothetical protein
MKSVLTTAVLALSLAAASAFAQDISKATTQADCEKVGGQWDAHTNGCGEGSAKMGKEEGTHQGANVGTTPDHDTQKVEQPDRSDPATSN